MPRESPPSQPLYADIDGFSRHAAVCCATDDCQALNQLCRGITRSAPANKRVQTNAAGQVVLKLLEPSGPTAPPTSSCRRWSSCGSTVDGRFAGAKSGIATSAMGRLL
jgi:hypothetical protein